LTKLKRVCSDKDWNDSVKQYPVNNDEIDGTLRIPSLPAMFHGAYGKIMNMKLANVLTNVTTDGSCLTQDEIDALIAQCNPYVYQGEDCVKIFDDYGAMFIKPHYSVNPPKFQFTHSWSPSDPDEPLNKSKEQATAISSKINFSTQNATKFQIWVIFCALDRDDGDWDFTKDTSRAIIIGYVEAEKNNGDWTLSKKAPPGATGYPWALHGRTFKN
jgi:hypothetical protein